MYGFKVFPESAAENIPTFPSIKLAKMFEIYLGKVFTGSLLFVLCTNKHLHCIASGGN